ncbi:hypothetical protein F164LOC_18160 [Pectobacterium carotovorum]|uniref:transcription termination/antitermination NusG family protein n=1 Tax=Pectobacterium versatile TaxID=2488639 RepID=UPI000C7EDA60|nr:transcription termination/antitermination NusG family protein [Pectobacterium versatile]PLY35821.1 hypothetical protein F164LOC_18160 [Pectobacterium carotovorum]
MQEWCDAWYLLRCRENAWKMTLQNLDQVGLKTCCPVIIERRRRRDKKESYRLINIPAFPGYIFVKFNPSLIHTTAIQSIPGAIDFVRFGNNMATIAQEEIDAMQRVRYDSTHGTIRLESELLSEKTQKRIAEIYSSEKPGVRIDLLFSMLTRPNNYVIRSENSVPKNRVQESIF